MVQDRRLTEWIDLAGDLLQRPLPEFPGEAIGRQLDSLVLGHGRLLGVA